jgi:two-component system response regulator YesN
VDDDPAVQDVVPLFLSDIYDVKQATNGAEAITILRREPVVAVVLDYRLPDRTGFEILTEIRSTWPHLPVVMMTGYGSEWLCASAFKLGIEDYLPKPVSALDLVAAVQRILSPGRENNDCSSEIPAPIGPSASLPIPVQKAMGLIQQRYWDHLSLSGLARDVGMSKYRLSHRFREVLGVTFRDYLLRVRLERAKTLLAAGSASISEVAQNVGFGDLPRFDKLFKRYTGLTPTAYRRSNKVQELGNKLLATAGTPL